MGYLFYWSKADYFTLIANVAVYMPYISDFVNGALNKLKSSRTPSITPQQDRTGRCLLYKHSKWKCFSAM